MKKTFFHSIIGATMFATILLSNSCKTDVDFSNIDMTAEVGMSLALPVGTVSATISDFINNENITQYLDTTEDGVLRLHIDFDINRPYTAIDLGDYSTHADLFYNVSNTDFTFVSVEGAQFPAITIPLEMEMLGCNTEEDIAEFARIDSFYVKQAQFSTTLSVENWDIPSSYIKSVSLVLSDDFRQSTGTNIVPLEFTNWGETMFINIEDFYLSMLLDRSVKPSTKAIADANVKNVINAQIKIEVEVPQGQLLAVSRSSQVHAVLHSDIFEVNAIWGYFFPGNQMREEGSEDLSNELILSDNITKLNLMLADPSIELNVNTAILAPISVNVDELSVTDKSTGDTYFAQFENGHRTVWNYITLNDYNSYLSTIPGTVFYGNYTLTADPKHGDLTRLFQTIPDILNYNFNIDVNEENRHLQHRITTDSDVNLNVGINIPLTFNKGMELAYCDTIDDVNIEVNLNSMIEDVEVIDELKTSEVVLRLMAQSTIPLDVNLGFKFLDANNREIDFRDLIESQSITISAPTVFIDGKVDETQPGENDLVITVSSEHFDRLSQVRKIVYNAGIKANDDIFKNNDIENISVLATSGLKIKIGVAASLEAILNLNFEDL